MRTICFRDGYQNLLGFLVIIRIIIGDNRPQYSLSQKDGTIVFLKAHTIDPLTAVTGIIEADGSTDELIEEIRGQADAT